MSDKAASIIQKAMQERKRAQFGRALKRLEQGIAAHPEELDLYLEAIDCAIEGGELLQATNLLKTVQDKFTKERERVQQFVREKLQTVHDPSLARCAVEHAVKRRELEPALEMLTDVPDHTIRELLKRASTKAQSLKSAAGGGYSLRGETVVNELTNAILAIRLGNLNDAMATIVSVVEEKPAEAKAIDAFLAALAPRHAKAGAIRHARGCTLRAGGNEIDAIHQFLEAAHLEPECAATSAAQLQTMLATGHHPGKIRRALAEAQLLEGKIDDAALTLREYIAENPENSREVIMLLRPFIDPARGINACTWLALEQSIGLEQSTQVLELMRPLQAKGHGSELLPWLEEHLPPLPPTELTVFHAALALDAKQYEHAAGLLGDVCVASPQEVDAVLALIDRHRSADESIDALYRKYSHADDAPSAADTSDDDGFQTFEANEFRLEKSSNAPAAPSTPATEKPKPRFNTSPFSSAEKKDEPSDKPMIERHELSFEDDGSIHREQESTEITEEHVTNVGQKLYDAGAAAFFHIDDEASAGAAPAPAADEAPTRAAPEPAAEVETPEPSAEPAPAVATSAPAAAKETFDDRYGRFSRGELSNSAILALLEEAVEDGRADELHEILYFEPETGEEHFARYYYQAAYHVLCNRPLQALEILARLDTPGLEAADKQRVWYKIAVAQRMTHNFAGASETLDRLVQHFPDREEFARLKRRNQEQIIEEQSLAATTLEKTSSLD